MFAGFVEPDEEQFSKAKKISRLRLIGAGPTSNVIFAFALRSNIIYKSNVCNGRTRTIFEFIL